MIDSGWLTDLVFTTVQSNVNLKRVKTSGNDFQLAALSAAVNTRPTNEIIVQAWKHRVGERKSTLVFCVDKAHVTSLTAMFRAHGVEAEYVTSDTTRSVRANRLEEFKAGRLPVLLNCGVFTEGTDIPNIDCVLLARPTKSQNLLVQMIGRGVRLHAGKKDCLVIDMVSSLATGIVTTPTLFGLDSDELVEHFNKEQMEDLRDRREKEFEQETAAAEAARPGSFAGTLDFTTYDSVHDLIADTSAERHIRGLSHLAWVNVGDGRHVLLNRGGDYIMIEPASTASDPAVKFAVRYMARLPEGAKAKAPYAKAREVARAQTFPEAVRAADTCADLAFERQFVLRRAAWRNAEASEKQLGFLNKMRDEEDLLTSTSVTKGEAADMITKVRFGARGRFKQGKREVEDRRKRFRAKR
ncbi:MAG: hypothetical protein INR71_14840 [Terriglobus roseus]|nr:hypothetical protein [Terriglobus roseus]